MAGEDNLIPLNERTKEEQREITKKGGIASGKARRRKSNIKKALETILMLDVPDDAYKKMLSQFGLEPTMENALVLRTIMNSISDANPKDLETIAKLIGQTTTLADRQEQKARTERMKLESERLKHEVAVKTGQVGKEESEAQTMAIADLINGPLEPRTLTDFMASIDTETAQEAEEATDD